MEQISITVATAGSPAATQPQVPVSPADRAFTQAVSNAIRHLNTEGYVGQGREVTFSVDPSTHRPVVKVVDTDTREVLHQLPPEYVLQLAEADKHTIRDSG
jgi:flagellar protein FlaG